MGLFPCGCCGRSDTCTINLTKPNRTFIPSTNCPYYDNFTLKTAGTSTDANPTTNRPIICNICASQTANKLHDNTHVFWSYNMDQHIRTAHNGAVPPSSDFRASFAVSEDERKRLGVLEAVLRPISRLRPRGSKKPPMPASSRPSGPGPSPLSQSSTSIGSSSQLASETHQVTGSQQKRARSTTNTMHPNTSSSSNVAAKRPRASDVA